MNLPLPTQNNVPWLPWHRRIMRQRHYLEYWLDGQHHSEWVTEFSEIAPDTIEFQDYVTDRVTRIRSDQTIQYRITKYS